MKKLVLLICFSVCVFGGIRAVCTQPSFTGFVLSPSDRVPPDEPAEIRISGKQIEFVYNGRSIFKGELTSNINDVEIRQLKNRTGDAVTQVIKFASRSSGPVNTLQFTFLPSIFLNYSNGRA